MTSAFGLTFKLRFLSIDVFCDDIKLDSLSVLDSHANHIVFVLDRCFRITTGFAPNLTIESVEEIKTPEELHDKDGSILGLKNYDNNLVALQGQFNVYIFDKLKLVQTIKNACADLSGFIRVGECLYLVVKSMDSVEVYPVGSSKPIFTADTDLGSLYTIQLPNQAYFGCLHENQVQCWCLSEDEVVEHKVEDLHKNTLVFVFHDYLLSYGYDVVDVLHFTESGVKTSQFSVSPPPEYTRARLWGDGVRIGDELFYISGDTLKMRDKYLHSPPEVCPVCLGSEVKEYIIPFCDCPQHAVCATCWKSMQEQSAVVQMGVEYVGETRCPICRK